VTPLAPGALGSLPQGLRTELLQEFGKITRNYRENRWEAAELNGGRFCEIVYTILDGYLDGHRYATAAFKPKDMKTACDALAQRGKGTAPDSVRISIPRVLVALYQIRNNRGVGHVGGDVDANQMDAAYVLHSVQWVMAELVRIYHQTDVKTATDTVSALVDRTVPIIWETGEVRRVLDTSLSLSDATLVLAYAAPGGVSETRLAKDLEQDRLPNYRRVLARLHSSRKIEYTKATGLVVISPPGIRDVEERLLTEP
jgi:hypothetical protein